MSWLAINCRILHISNNKYNSNVSLAAISALFICMPLQYHKFFSYTFSFYCDRSTCLKSHCDDSFLPLLQEIGGESRISVLHNDKELPCNDETRIQEFVQPNQRKPEDHDDYVLEYSPYYIKLCVIARQHNDKVKETERRRKLF